MQNIEPFYLWRKYYNCEKDKNLPFYNSQINDFECINTIYNYYINPQWDSFGSSTLYIKIIFIDYKKHIAFIEIMGEWNDLIENDIMKLKRNIIDLLIQSKIFYFIIIADNVLNFFRSDDEYYLEWQEDLEINNGWICIVNLPQQSKYEFDKIILNTELKYIDIENWKTFTPIDLFLKIKKLIKTNLLI